METIPFLRRLGMRPVLIMTIEGVRVWPPWDEARMLYARLEPWGA